MSNKPPIRLDESVLLHALRETIADDDEVVWISSGIWTFGHRFGWPTREIPARILAVILEAIGQNRTLLLPSYTFSYARSRVYDIVETKPETGVIPQAALRDPHFTRTPKPINSYLVTGPRTEEVLNLPCSTAWGEDSVMGWVEKMDARLCILGVPWHEACSFYHRAEVAASVPYRFYKRFPGTLLRAGKPEGACEETMFVGSLKVRPIFDWSLIRNVLPSHGTVLAGHRAEIFVESARAKAVQAAGRSILDKNPYGLLKNADLVKDWVKAGRAQEIEELATNDRSPLNN